MSESFPKNAEVNILTNTHHETNLEQSMPNKTRSSKNVHIAGESS